MMRIDEEVEVLGVLHQSDAEQPVVIDVERCYQSLLLRLDVGDVLHLQRKGLTIVDGLHGFTLRIQCDACEQRGMSSHGLLYRCLELGFVHTAVEDIQERQVVVNLS